MGTHFFFFEFILFLFVFSEGDLGIEEIFKPEIVEAVKEDFEYLQKMKDMDMEISLNSQSEGEEEEEEEVKRRIEMTDVVPVGGLIMARFIIIFYFLFCILYFLFFIFYFLFCIFYFLFFVFYFLFCIFFLFIFFLFRFHMEEVEHSTAMDLWGDTLNTRSIFFFFFIV